MAKEELLEFDGTVTEVLPDGNYRVTLDNEHFSCWPTCRARCRKFRIRTASRPRHRRGLTLRSLARPHQFPPQGRSRDLSDRRADPIFGGIEQAWYDPGFACYRAPRS